MELDTLSSNRDYALNIGTGVITTAAIGYFAPSFSCLNPTSYLIGLVNGVFQTKLARSNPSTLSSLASLGLNCTIIASSILITSDYAIFSRQNTYIFLAHTCIIRAINVIQISRSNSQSDSANFLPSNPQRQATDTGIDHQVEPVHPHNLPRQQSVPNWIHT